jgi:hypothetical protein
VIRENRGEGRAERNQEFMSGSDDRRKMSQKGKVRRGSRLSMRHRE